MIWEIVSEIQRVTGWDLGKTLNWMNTENPLFGGETPLKVIEKFGKQELIELIERGKKYRGNENGKS